MNSSTVDTPDFLDEDFVKVSGQNYALISFVSKNSRQKLETSGGDSEKIGIKIRGVFGTKEEAEAHVKKLMKFDNAFDIYVTELYKWLLAPPNTDEIEDQVYQEDYLNDMVKGYKEAQLLAKQQFEERKRLIKEKGLEAALSKEERLPEPVEALPEPVQWIPDDPNQPSSSAAV